MFLRAMAVSGLMLSLLAPVAHAADAPAVAIQLASGVGSAGSTDQRVSLAGGTAFICSSQSSSWAAALSGSGWISPNADCTTSVAAGTYTYATSFTVPSGASNLNLSGLVLADDGVAVSLNGTTVPLSGSTGFQNASSFSTNTQSQFVTGTNTLTFTVTNFAGLSGLDFTATVSGTGITQSAGVSPGGAHDDDQGGSAHGEHGHCVARVAHQAAHGRGHGEAVRNAAHSCPRHGDDD